MKKAGRVQGKVAIVTGAASGIGEGCARVLAREGASIAVADIDEEGGKRVAEEINAKGGVAKFFRLDVTDESQWQTVVSDVVGAFGGLNILVNNAGIGIGGLCEHFSLKDWRRQTAVNLDGVFLGTKHAIPAMRKSGKGSVVIISSGAGLMGTPGMSGYCATKAGVRYFAKAVALELAHGGDDIRVNSVHPGLVETAIWAKVDDQTRAVFGPAVQDGVVDVRQLAKASVPGGRVGTPEDIGEGVLYLASDESRYVTGAELAIDGGVTAA